MIQEKFSLPEGWEVRELGEVTGIIMGQSPPSKTYNAERKGLPFFQGKAEFGDMYPIPRKWCTKPKKVAKKNDILMSVRAPVGPVNLSNSECCIGRGLCAIRADIDKLNYKYLYNFLKLQEDFLSQKGQGSTFTAINKNDVYDITIPIPFPNDLKKSLEIQSHIVSKLDAFFEHFNKLKEEKQKARRQYDRILQSAIASLIPQDELPETWEWTILGDHLDIIQYGTSVKADATQETGVPILRMGNISEGQINYSDLKYMNPTNEDIGKYLLKRGDILINRTNSPELVGKSAVFNKPEKFVFASYLIRLCTNKSNLDSIYANFIINSTIGRSYVAKVKHQVAGQANINSKDIRSMPIPLPPLEEQHRIVAHLNAIFECIEKLKILHKEVLQKVETIPKSVLSKAFRGELV